ncbi:MAG: alpha/beta hydrolase [Saprospiraceae bacterium]|nr:alpha/beta hydrolase [Saprospiraceae bacterium]
MLKVANLFGVVAVGMMICTSGAISQDLVIPLYNDDIPCSNALEVETTYDSLIGRRISKVHSPELHVFLPTTPSPDKTGIIICPGGGYVVQAWDWEGTRIAKWFNELGLTAFVLRYRLPHWEKDSCRSTVALMDAQRAIRLVRARAGEWQVSEDKIGIMGFSAGGHLASSAATMFDHSLKNAVDDTTSSRPDFAILMYPVITMDSSWAHMGSRRNLLGENPPQRMLDLYSTEKQVTSLTPPTLLIHASDDRGVVPANSILFYQALLANGVPAALHIYAQGGHGFSFGKGRGAVENWPTLCSDWLREQGFLSLE